jgi:DMSO/TMAO reductase YedYZ molybdopterin-dependent catalytic subunit
MKHTRNLLFLGVFALLGVLLLAGLAGCGGGAPKVDWELEISGAVNKPLTLSYSELVKMPQVDLKDILMEKSLGEDVVGSWTGVKLEGILSQAEVNPDYVGITAIAADGYAVEISKEELQDSIVALRENKEWIATADQDHGPIRLVCPHTPANRWVFQLQELQVNEAGAQ